ncbi:hypothetical protein BsWGS_14547 [Bradybaena similaris]
MANAPPPTTLPVISLLTQRLTPTVAPPPAGRPCTPPACSPRVASLRIGNSIWRTHTLWGISASIDRPEMMIVLVSCSTPNMLLALN